MREKVKQGEGKRKKKFKRKTKKVKRWLKNLIASKLSHF